jgi:hypothetical protein
MVRRLVWMLIGMGFGLGSSFWVMRRVRETVARYSPPRVSAEVAGSVRGLGRDLRLAVAEGREAMAQREAELRAEVTRTPG